MALFNDKNPRMQVSFFTFTRDMLVGGSAAAVAKTAIAPIERVKLLLQLQATSTQLRPENQYKGILDCLVRIPREQGFASYWRGNLTNVYRYFCTQSLNFAFKDAYKVYFCTKLNPGRDRFWRLFLSNLASGGAAGVTSMCITYPLDFARTRLSADVGTGSKRQFNGLIHCIRVVAAKEGVTGLYKGLSLSIPNVLVYRATYFGTFDTAKSLMSGNYRSPIVATWVLAQACTTVAGLIGYPLDTVRRRMVMQAGRELNQRHYKNTLDCWVKIYRTEGGLRGFYKGALSNVFRGAGSALVLVFYDEVKKVI
ncbi:unnamed protein product [Clavelina lepadiformis]|uniref:ADP/ATP translocase n=1 Tax=Clavelina lepadiformis TaxID=159417 RepID=A0ABP0GSQ2_CLALP